MRSCYMEKVIKKMYCHKFVRLVLGVCIFVTFAANVYANNPGWKRREIQGRIGGVGSLKAVNYPAQKPVPILGDKKRHRGKPPRRKLLSPEQSRRLSTSGLSSPMPVFASVIDSPPLDGFLPWVVVAVTDERLPELEMEATTEYSVVGNYITQNPQTDYIIGIFDTGATSHLMGYYDAGLAGIFDYASTYLTSNYVTIAGVSGTVDAHVSQPLALFMDGLSIIDPNGLLTDTSTMLGQSNVSISVGMYPGPYPDLPTVIGTPLSVYFTTVFYSDQIITVSRDGNDYNAPDIHIYEHDSNDIPDYSNMIPLELRPLGAASVYYTISLQGFLEFPPMTPSIIVGNLSQSLFFLPDVDLYQGSDSSIYNDRFMFDTGAQVTVIGSRVAARLRLDPDSNDFTVEIQDVTGDITNVPGFYIDLLEIPALGTWLSFTNVPVVLIDIFSPEGGTLDGIIGMNLFNDINFVLRGGGMFLQDDPAIFFEHVGKVADIAPAGGDDVVNHLDLAVLVDAWLATAQPQSANWNLLCDIAPLHNPDGRIDLLDFAVLARYWFYNTSL